MFLGCADRAWVVDKAIRFEDSFLLSGIDVGSVARVWRYTPAVHSDTAVGFARQLRGATPAQHPTEVHTGFGRTGLCTLGHPLYKIH